ncbi:hypothetical protein Bca4012_052516 [Brassica carinata]
MRRTKPPLATSPRTTLFRYLLAGRGNKVTAGRAQAVLAWAKVLESACKDDEELRAVLGDSIGNPELMRKKVTNWWFSSLHVL